MIELSRFAPLAGGFGLLIALAVYFYLRRQAGGNERMREISGLIEQVASLIQGIETASKLLVINEINVRSFAITGVPPRRPDGTSALPQQNMRVSLTVSGFVRNEPLPVSPPAKDAAKQAPSDRASKAPLESELRQPRQLRPDSD